MDTFIATMREGHREQLYFLDLLRSTRSIVEQREVFYTQLEIGVAGPSVANGEGELLILTNEPGGVLHLFRTLLPGPSLCGAGGGAVALELAVSQHDADLQQFLVLMSTCGDKLEKCVKKVLEVCVAPLREKIRGTYTPAILALGEPAPSHFVPFNVIGGEVCPFPPHDILVTFEDGSKLLAKLKSGMIASTLLLKRELVACMPGLGRPSLQQVLDEMIDRLEKGGLSWNLLMAGTHPLMRTVVTEERQ